MTEPTDFWASPQPGTAGVPWAQPAPTAAPGMNPWAVVALVTGILPLPPVAIAAGGTALFQNGRRPAKGTGLAIAGLALAGIWSLVGVVFAAFTAFSPWVSDPLGRVGDVGALRVGACLSNPASDASRFAAVSCSSEHDAEVYAVPALALAGADWLGADEVQTRADDLCYGAFAPYVGEAYDSSDYDYGFFAPDEDEWRRGERRAVCVVLAGYDPLPTTVRSEPIEGAPA
ncbi:MAG: hypothetical protein JWM40_69 [Frankiales bacterium]|nr:hypothetical protein [Frankiales bacterium]